MYKELKEQKLSSGYHFVGFVNVEEKAQYLLSEFIPKKGSLENIVYKTATISSDENCPSFAPMSIKTTPLLKVSIEAANNDFTPFLI